MTVTVALVGFDHTEKTEVFIRSTGREEKVCPAYFNERNFVTVLLRWMTSLLSPRRYYISGQITGLKSYACFGHRR